MEEPRSQALEQHEQQPPAPGRTRTRSRRGPVAGWPARAACIAVLALAMAPGCAGWRGARLYTSGADALGRGESEQAIAHLEAAAEELPARVEIYNHLGIAYTAAGRHADAVEAFERAVELDCNGSVARENLELARHRAAAATPATRAARDPDPGS